MPQHSLLTYVLSAPVFQQPVNDWEYVLWDYLEQSLTQHELLFSGKVSPLSLLLIQMKLPQHYTPNTLH